MVFETGGFRFYAQTRERAPLAAGGRFEGSGSLGLDWYEWKEGRWFRPVAPRLFFPSTVKRILLATWPAADRPGRSDRAGPETDQLQPNPFGWEDVVDLRPYVEDREEEGPEGWCDGLLELEVEAPPTRSPLYWPHA